MALAIIGGTGLADMAGRLAEPERKEIDTPFGLAVLTEGDAVEGNPLIVLARHGETHELLPHEINYRANIWALKERGVTSILAVAAVGSLKTDLKPGDFVLVDQFLDFTSGRAATFAGEGGAVDYVDVTDPYDANLRRLLMSAADEAGAVIHRVGTYVVTQGPRFETAAEIKMFRSLGADVVGMTGVPEVVLASELGIPYACLAVVTNYAAGMAGHRLTYEECAELMAEREEKVWEIFLGAARSGGLLE